MAWGRDYSDVAPINGIVTGGGDHLIEVGVDVIPVEYWFPSAGADPFDGSPHSRGHALS